MSSFDKMVDRYQDYQGGCISFDEYAGYDSDPRFKDYDIEDMDSIEDIDTTSKPLVPISTYDPVNGYVLVSTPDTDEIDDDYIPF